MTRLLRLNRMHYPVTVLGPGRRLGIWVQGCSIGCPGCVARDTWDPAASAGQAVSDVVALVDTLVDGPIDGVTISGGEPFDQSDALVELLPHLRRWLDQASDDGDLLAYSGYEYDDLRVRTPAVVASLDALITGPYRVGQSSDAVWWGSANQELHLLTARGKRKYADLPTERGIQIDVDAGGHVWMIGVPARATLARVERDLKSRGIELKDVSWRP